MHPEQIPDRAALDAALSAPRYLIFKHSEACPISRNAFEEFVEFLAPLEGMPAGWFDVREHRGWAAAVADATGILHESPQAIWIRDGQPAWNASHGSITRAELARATAD